MFFKQNPKAEANSFFKRNPEPISTKKKVSAAAIMLFSATFPLVSRTYVGDLLWYACVLSFVAFVIYVVWFMKD